MPDNDNKTKDLLVFVSSNGCHNCVKIDTKVFKNKLRIIASKYNKDFIYIPLKANTSKIVEEHPNIPRTLGNFTWFFPLFMLVDKDQWNTNTITNPYIMDGKISSNGKVTAIQRLPYPLNLSGVESWLKDITSGKISNKIEPISINNNKLDNNKLKTDNNTNEKNDKVLGSYKTSIPADDLLGQGPFMNDSKIDEEFNFCECSIQPKNKANRVKI